MAKKSNKSAGAKKTVEALRHEGTRRAHIPTAEFESVMEEKAQYAKKVKYPRNTDLDPQLVWRGKDEQDWSDLVVHAPPLYIQEKVKPKILIDELLARTQAQEDAQAPDLFADMYADFNGVPDGGKTDFYQHDANWSNRMILGDSLQVMASLAEREGLRGKVQCIYFDPPYGIKFNSNFQWSTTGRDVKDGNRDHITREPEQVKAFRDTWRDGIHSYLTYLRDRLTVARDLLADPGSIFVQIGDENVHLVRAMMDEVFGATSLKSQIAFRKTAGQSSLGLGLSGTLDYILHYAKNPEQTKYRQIFSEKELGSAGAEKYQYAENAAGVRTRILPEWDATRVSEFGRPLAIDTLVSQRPPGDFPVDFQGREIRPRTGYWKTGQMGMARLIKAGRITPSGQGMMYKRFLDDFAAIPFVNYWHDTSSGASTLDPKVYVVQTATKVIQRCILMATDPGDLVLDPTCGSGTTAYVAEQWGRRWITIDTSRVALALARARIMGARYPYYLLSDSPEGQEKEAEVTRTAPKSAPTHGDIRHGFVYERVPHITLKSIANNAEIDVIWEKWQQVLEPIRERINTVFKKSWQEWEMPREFPGDPRSPNHPLNRADNGKELLARWWEARIARQKEIDASIAAKAEYEYLYDKPYEDKKKVRVAGPFTVESLSPHRVLTVDEDDRLVDVAQAPRKAAKSAARDGDHDSFVRVILENLKTAGVQQAHKEDKIAFTALAGWPGNYICAEGRYPEGGRESGKEKRAGIFIGPEFGTVARADLISAAKEAGDADFDVVIACAFNYEARAAELDKLGRIPILKARMNADLHMAADLKNTGKGNLFVIFGEPDIEILKEDGPPSPRSGAASQYRVKIKGVDVFHPQTGEVRSDGAEGIACWFLDTDYNEESFFVRHAYFLGQNDPYKSLKTTLKAEINEDAWATLNSDTSRPFPKPKSGRIAVKVINHLGDEVMKVFKVGNNSYPRK
ncbi:MAG: site-specific DNA-methyltransferase [Planctomycetes bacterium]|nr:site-specific DNA-methyltransferase [Planctomycetota bacterium]